MSFVVQSKKFRFCPPLQRAQLNFWVHMIATLSLVKLEAIKWNTPLYGLVASWISTILVKFKLSMTLQVPIGSRPVACNSKTSKAKFVLKPKNHQKIIKKIIKKVHKVSQINLSKPVEPLLSLEVKQGTSEWPKVHFYIQPKLMAEYLKKFGLWPITEAKAECSIFKKFSSICRFNLNLAPQRHHFWVEIGFKVLEKRGRVLMD